MSDTLNVMEYVYADILFIDQLMEDDYIEVLDDNEPIIVQVKNIISLDNGYCIETINDFGETAEYLFADDAKVNLFVFQ